MVVLANNRVISVTQIVDGGSCNITGVSGEENGETKKISAKKSR
jgi:hypothetical protein